MKVLIIGHACSPRQGSESSFTWNWAWHLSRLHHQVWVVAHPHDRKHVERFSVEHPNENLRFHHPRESWASQLSGGRSEVRSKPHGCFVAIFRLPVLAKLFAVSASVCCLFLPLCGAQPRPAGLRSQPTKRLRICSAESVHKRSGSISIRVSHPQ